MWIRDSVYVVCLWVCEREEEENVEWMGVGEGRVFLLYIFLRTYLQ